MYLNPLDTRMARLANTTRKNSFTNIYVHMTGEFNVRCVGGVCESEDEKEKIIN